MFTKVFNFYQSHHSLMELKNERRKYTSHCSEISLWQAGLCDFLGYVAGYCSWINLLSYYSNANSEVCARKFTFILHKSDVGWVVEIFHIKRKASNESVSRVQTSTARKIFFYMPATVRGYRKYKILLGNAGDYGTFPRDNTVAIESVIA